MTQVDCWDDLPGTALYPGLIIPFALAQTTETSMVLKQKIGRGTYSTCWVASFVREESRKLKHKVEPESLKTGSDSVVVLKVMKTSEKARAMWTLETSIHSLLDHSSVVTFFYSFVHHNTPMYTMELCTGGSLARAAKVNILDLAEIRAYTTQLLDAVQYIHSEGIVHRDIKPGNVLLTGYTRAKLCDFGLAARWRSGEPLLCKKTGTPNYVAPEIIRKSSAGYTNQIDCWSLGCTIYFMYTGQSLYRVSRGDKKALFRAIRKEPVPNLPSRCKGTMKEVLRRLLQKDPNRRITAVAAHHRLVETSASNPSVGTP